MNFNIPTNNNNGLHFAMMNIPLKPPEPVKQEELRSMDDIVVDLEYIITEKPKPKIVREFLRENLASIKTPEEEMFGI